MHNINFMTLDDCHHPALLLVDGVSSIGALDFRMDEWGVDVALTSSQKALSLPTGLGILCVSPKALEASKSSKSVKAFFDWGSYLKLYEMGTYWPYTPSIQLLYGLRAALDLFFEEGLENVFARHTRLANATRYQHSTRTSTISTRFLEYLKKYSFVFSISQIGCEGVGIEKLLAKRGMV